ncbi:MAG TPA: CocE/NonD family hydrolase [Candidatus Binataceae bacterium]|nr:CocE/NonD family hydrolase [Candidatus Binataceae bacterium]
MTKLGRQGSEHRFEVVVERDVMVAMRDGTRLATDIYRPALEGAPAPGRFPVLIERTPYDKATPRFVVHSRFFAEHGYVVLIQDVRGRGGSEGDWYPFAREAPDGYDTIEWAAAEPWCTGKVGTMGTSYMGAVQSAAATLNPPHLAAMFVTEGPSNYYACSMRHNGALEQRFLIYAFHMAVTSPEARANPALRQALLEARLNLGQWLRRLPLKRGASPLRLLPTYEQWVIDLQTRAAYDEYWRQRGYAIDQYYAEHADVPTVYFGAWYDSYARATVENFAALSRLKRSPQRLVMGPWTHGVRADEDFAGEASFGPAALEHYNGMRLRWFDQWLKGLDTGVADQPAVRIFVMGGGSGRKLYDVLGLSGRIDHGGRWRLESQWPPAGVRETPWYLHRGGALAPRTPEEDGGASTFRYDPRDPVPTVGGCISVGFEFMPPGGFDQRARFPLAAGESLPLAARPDVMVFVSEPLAESLEVTGSPLVKLWVSSSARDTDFTAKLIDLYPPSADYPDGYALNLTDSIIRMRFRNSWTDPQPMTPGEIYEVSIPFYPISNLFARGHRIRLDISSSNFPRFDVNPNTGGALGEPGAMVVADNTVHHAAAHPSHIVLPVMTR